VTAPTIPVGNAQPGRVALLRLSAIALAIKPDLPQRPNTLFGAIMTGSFVLTTVGYLGAAWYVACAAVLGS